MDKGLTTKGFAAIGARVKLAPMEAGRLRAEHTDSELVLDVLRDSKGEYFRVALRPGADPEAVVRDVARQDRHLLLEVRQGEALTKFLCGHDERHFFVAGVPAGRGAAANVSQAKEALKPEDVREAQRGVRTQHRHVRQRRSRNPVLRQGEWFFVPVPRLDPPEDHLLHDEPLRRGRAAPHTAELLYRTGGVTVYVCDAYPEGLTQEEYDALLAEDAAAQKGRQQAERRSVLLFRWRVMRRGAQAYVKGRITHRDHATLVLPGWYRVVPSAEQMEHVAFLD